MANGGERDRLKGKLPPLGTSARLRWDDVVLVAQHVETTEIAWDDVLCVDASGPFPMVEIRYDLHEVTQRLLLAEEGWELKPWERELSKLFDWMDEHHPDKVDRGWVGLPDLDAWAVEGMPGDRATTDRGGPFRVAQRIDADDVLAVRGPPSPMEALLRWVASRTGRSRDAFPRRVEVTREHVFIERPDRQCFRLERRWLRGRRTSASADRVYYYSKRLLLLLPHRPDCPVVRLLDHDFITLAEA